MKRSKRRADQRTRNPLLCLEQLESRLPLSAVSHWESKSLGTEHYDARDNATGLVQAYEVDTRISHSADRAASREHSSQSTKNPSRSDSVLRSYAEHASEIGRRATSDRTASQAKISQISTQSLSYTFAIRQYTASLSTASSSTGTTTLVRQRQVEETPTTFGASIAMERLDDSLTTSSTSAKLEDNSSLAASVAMIVGRASEPQSRSSDVAPVPRRLTPFAWRVAAEEDQTESNAVESLDAETRRFGGVIGLERMPLLQDTLPLINRRSTTHDELDLESDGESDDLILTPELPGSLDADESKAKSANEERNETTNPSAHSSSTPRSTACDITFADADSVEAFGGLIDVIPPITPNAVAEGEVLFSDPMIPISALQVDAILGQAPLLELEGETPEGDQNEADPISINIRAAAPASAAMTLIPAIFLTRQKATRRGSKGECRHEFIPE